MIAPKRLASGRYVDLMSMTQDDIFLDDIDIALNYLYRFTGHHKDKEPLTVAQHTTLVYSIAKKLFPDEKDVHVDCVLHDFPEAYYGDLATPLKRVLGPAYREYADEVDSLVYGAFWPKGVIRTSETEEKTKVCDLMALDIERRNMWVSQLGKDKWPSIHYPGSLAEKMDLFDDIQRQRIWSMKELYKEVTNG